jgi:bifunctional DNA-binding transcriptional regulator/antitoxin component of YhaV-PrlF toxin-antitoxin module
MRGVAIPKDVGETTITGKNQISLPAESVRALGWERGDRLTVKIQDENTLLLIRQPRTADEWVEMFSGKMGDVFGDHEDTLRYLDELREGWGRVPNDDSS